MWTTDFKAVQHEAGVIEVACKVLRTSRPGEKIGTNVREGFWTWDRGGYCPMQEAIFVTIICRGHCCTVFVTHLGNVKLLVIQVRRGQDLEMEFAEVQRENEL